MKYTTTIDIELPIEKVVELFDNPDNMTKWQPELISFENFSGKPGEQGAKSKLKYKMGKREVEMIETIVKRDLPKEFSGTYEAKDVWNMQKNTFETIDNNKTRWITESEFQFKGFMKLMAVFMPGTFKKQTFKFMERFKTFAEKQQ